MDLSHITPLILTFNESANIARTLEPLQWASQIILLDSGSSDDTCAIAQSFCNVGIHQRPFDSHTAQWNYGLNLVSTEWVVTLDADYQLSPQLIDEIKALGGRDDVAGYVADFQFLIFGRPLRSCVYPPRIVLFRRDLGNYVDDGHTQRLEIKGKIMQLSGKIYHDDRKPLSRWLKAQDAYTLIEARHLLHTPMDRPSLQDRLRRRIYFAPAAMFLYLLFFRGLILDGWPGWFYVFQRTLAETLLSLRLFTERERLEAKE
jgi:glycosyltransferase involved in cell wall biosynthesis